MILFDRLARAPIDGRRAGFRCGVRVDSASGPRWWIPTGPWGPPGIHLRSPARCLILRLFQALLGGLRPGWTPKKIALSLAKFRASPPRIRFQPGRTRKINRLGAEAHTVSQLAAIGQRNRSINTFVSRSPFRRSQPVRPWSQITPAEEKGNPLRCLTKNCLTYTKGVDRPHDNTVALDQFFR